ncbi:unnamed protein product [Orchesella dallaii]|uniref:Uncharacterized protein n=1 Tax=Orchesella dallaii TaxID=48710 RepID=A0ABP1RHG4_9HEXA
MTQLIQFIGRFTKTLASLHLDFKEDSFDFLERSAERDAIFLSLSFPNVHTFGIFYPRRIEEWCLVKQFLGMFPNLRKLNLLRLDRARDADPQSHFTLPDDTADVFHFITKSKRRILGICPDLKLITVEYRHSTWFTFKM